MVALGPAEQDVLMSAQRVRFSRDPIAALARLEVELQRPRP